MPTTESAQHQSSSEDMVPHEDALITTSRDNLILSWNRGAELLFGYTSREVIGKNIALLFSEKHREVDALNARDAVSGLVVRNSVSKGTSKANGPISMIYTLVPIRDSGERVVGLLRICKDISAFKTAQSALRQAIHQLSQMDQIHDPMLQAMRQNAGFLAPSPLAEESSNDPVAQENLRSRREFLRIIDDECRSIIDLVEEARGLLR